MSLKTNTILIRPASLGGDADELLENLGYAKRRRLKKPVPFATAGGGSIWIGAIGDCTIIYKDLAWHFFDRFANNPDLPVPDPLDEFVFLKSSLLRQFPVADIAALVLNGVVDAWGFAVFRNRALIRCCYGADGAIFADEGARLPAENDFLANYDRIDADGQVLYRSRSHPSYEPMSVADLGEAFVCEVWRSFTGHEFDSPELFHVQGTEFWLNDDEAEFRARCGRPWWKFWG
ncbi:MAG: hypothetical protein HC829_04235 [Bacteroidales bacterium]|nr:hypothetical protein [Bacteroidales bacterium]